MTHPHTHAAGRRSPGPRPASTAAGASCARSPPHGRRTARGPGGRRLPGRAAPGRPARQRAARGGWAPRPVAADHRGDRHRGRPDHRPDRRLPAAGPGADDEPAAGAGTRGSAASTSARWHRDSAPPCWSPCSRTPSLILVGYADLRKHVGARRGRHAARATTRTWSRRSSRPASWCWSALTSDPGASAGRCPTSCGTCCTCPATWCCCSASATSSPTARSCSGPVRSAPCWIGALRAGGRRPGLGPAWSRRCGSTCGTGCGSPTWSPRAPTRSRSTSTGERLRPAADAQAGQYFRWRFLARGCWWQSHPFSLSAAANGRWLRLTVKVGRRPHRATCAT